MALALIGKKSGMTRIFTEDGASIPVTVIEVTPNRVTQIRSPEVDGYSAVQVTAGSRKAKHLSKAQAGHFAKANVEAGRIVREYRLADGEEAPDLGSDLTVSLFEAGQLIDVIGTSKGKGFQGGVKRWNFAMQDATHGNSLSHRAPGSIGQNQTPGRVFKGKKMAGHMGAERVTVQSLEIVRIDTDRNLLLVKGAVPGSTGGDVLVRQAVKARS
ncbi:50S ribosomal protein L3 [Marinospirillum insulare]|uniref:Large ribosomal subunit protein uL3 n=1 Tax=Marinospirillum insulare TaxID=217169 RepID=A0ABQ5ZXS4_9GAMM|nr:50S ribosomal protein L3 [Marinospirillum insulare]GLR63451.1 50S ribosomal protein L3 [Marinospirillum insulare]